MTPPARGRQLPWLEALKAFAIAGILLNHLVEEFGPGPWFTNPSNDWPDLGTRLRAFFPADPSLPLAVLRFLGWLGDSGPGVFILVSGVGLAYSAMQRPAEAAPTAFFRRRVLRLFPLFIAMHLVVLTAALAVPGNELTLAGPKTLLSLLGLRFTPSLFFHISPSWWFVWTILQFYLVFPWLHRLMRNVGTTRFLALAVLFTLAARGYGILRSDSLYFWMTGLFFGTRLAEFAVGMAIGAHLAAVRDGEAMASVGAARALRWGIPVYLAGLAASLTLVGSLVSNLLVTLGLAALFYAAWAAMVKDRPAAGRVTMWAGAVAYPVFLLHQPPLMWTASFTPGNTGAHWAAALAVLVLCVPAGYAIDRAVATFMRPAQGPRATRVLRALAIVATAGTLLALLAVEPRLSLGTWRHRAFAVVLGGALVVLARREWGPRGSDGTAERVLRRGALLAGAATLFVFPAGFADAAAVLAVVLAALHAAAARLVVSPVRAWVAALLVGGGALASAELALTRIAPLEAGRWGEFPALERHPTRVYGLRPGQETRLRYNDYDYVLRTNGDGLAGPEIAPARPAADALRILVTGDAFTMPEGLPYEQSWTALLQDTLARCLRPRIVQVINAGVTGYGPREESAQLAELVPRYRPDVVVVQFFINEFVEAGLTEEERLRDIGLLARPRSQGLWTVSRSQVVAQVQRFRVAQLERVTGRNSDERYWKALLAFYRTGDGSPYTPDALAAVGSFLGAMQRTMAAAGARMAIAFVPGAVAVEQPADIAYFPIGEPLDDTTRYDLGRPLRSLRRLADPLGIPVWDLTPPLRAHGRHPVYFPTAWHWNAEGHRVVASAVAGRLAADGIVRCTGGGADAR